MTDFGFILQDEAGPLLFPLGRSWFPGDELASLDSFQDSSGQVTAADKNRNVALVPVSPTQM